MSTDNNKKLYISKKIKHLLVLFFLILLAIFLIIMSINLNNDKLNSIDDTTNNNLKYPNNENDIKHDSDTDEELPSYDTDEIEDSIDYYLFENDFLNITINFPESWEFALKTKEFEENKLVFYYHKNGKEFYAFDIIKIKKSVWNSDESLRHFYNKITEDDDYYYIYSLPNELPSFDFTDEEYDDYMNIVRNVKDVTTTLKIQK